jgi:hypothetical protein
MLDRREKRDIARVMRSLAVLVVVLAACSKPADKPAPAPAPVAAPVAAEPTPEELAAARPPAGVPAAPVVEKIDPADVRKDDGPMLARQQAIEAARNAGILGKAALTQGGAFASLTGTGDITSGFDDTNIYGGLLGNEPDDMQGGFGYGVSGVGPGGGGTGWGTIGTGRYGTLGHGSGTGSGYGVGGGRGGMRGRSSALPRVRIGQPSASGGDLDPAIIRRYIKRNIQKITYCYEKTLLAKPGLAGTVATKFTIEPNGTTSAATASGVDDDVAGCIAGVIDAIEFPKPKDGAAVTVHYPFTFAPS